MDHGPQNDPRLTFAATLPVKVPPRFAAMDLLAVVCDLLDGTGVTATIDPELSAVEDEQEGNRFFGRPQTPPRIALNVNSVTVTVVGRDKPAFTPAQLKQLDFGAWTSGKERFARSRAHLVLRELDGGTSADLDLNYDRATALTVVAAAINRLIGTIGMVWHTSNQVMPAESMPQMFKELLAGNAPVEVWIARLPLPNDASGVATRGFYPLLGAEIAVLSKQLSAAEAGQAANELAAEILRSGEAPSHGEKLHYERGVRFQVEHRAVGVDGGVPVVVLADVANAARAASSAGASGTDLSSGGAAPSDAAKAETADSDPVETEDAPAPAAESAVSDEAEDGPAPAEETAATEPADTEEATPEAAETTSEGAEEDSDESADETRRAGSGTVAASGGV